MIHRIRIIVGVIGFSVVLGAGTPLCVAQEEDNGAAGESTETSLPKMSDLLQMLDKASAPTPGEPGSDWSAPIKLAVVFAGLAVLPSLLVMMTSFTRIIIVLAFIRRALTTQSIPPTIALVGLALFLTLFTMSPTLGKINEQAVQPYLQDKITFQAACSKGNEVLKEFMISQTRPSDLQLFMEELGGGKIPESAAEIPTHIAIPSFAISEFRTAFEMGCLLFIPFLLVDLVVAGILLSAGMMMLPPAIISLPFKIILFVLVDGWRIVAKNLVSSFY